MRCHLGVSVLCGMLFFSGCEPDIELETDDQKASYGIGVRMGRQLAPGAARIDMGAYLLGVEHGLGAVDLLVPEDELSRIVETFSQSVIERAGALRDSLANKNVAEGDAYLSQNTTRDGVVTTATGLQYEVLQEGSGPTATRNDSVRVHFRGRLLNGVEFDGTSRPDEPATFSMGELIPGWVEALEMMSVGSKYLIVVPPDLAYGMEGMGRYVEPMATLIYEIELVEILD